LQTIATEPSAPLAPAAGAPPPA